MARRDEDVQHGWRGWVDYDRSWFWRKTSPIQYVPLILRNANSTIERQFLVTDYQASIMSNLVGMALTLAGPRLWIVVKAFCAWTIATYQKYRNNGVKASTFGSQHILLTHNLAVTQESHSELGAAGELVRSIWDELTPNRVQLQVNKAPPRRSRITSWSAQTKNTIIDIWNNCLRQPADISISLILSATLIGLFVAESSGSVLSANIVSDTVALAFSSNCSFPYTQSDLMGLFSGVSVLGYPLERANQYRQNCYNTTRRDGDCSFFFNQYISYVEQTNASCPFKGDTCWRGKGAAFTLDTGYVDANTIGLNAAKRYSFRRKTTCAPLVVAGSPLIQDFTGDPEGQNDYLRKPGTQKRFLGCDPLSNGFRQMASPFTLR